MGEMRAKLEKQYSSRDILALAFGTMIGWGWVALAGAWVSGGGWLGACLAYAVGAVLCIFVGLCYAELTPALPCAGGSLVFSYRALGYKGGWVAVWATCFAYVGVAAWEGIAIATAVDYIFPIPQWGYLWTLAGKDVYLSWSAVGMVVGLFIIALNYFGGKAAVWFQTAATILLAAVGAFFFGGSVTLGSLQNLGEAFTGVKGFIGVLLMTPAMFVGFDVIPQAAEEMNIPLNKLPRILILSILLAALWYVVICYGVAMATPPAVIANSTVAVADAATYVFNNPLMGKIVIFGAVCGILTSWNGFVIGGVRILFAMGRAKMLPPVFGKLHPKHKTPSAAVLLVGAICIMSPLLGQNALIWFVNASSFGTVVTYLLVCVAFMRLREQEPDLRRPYKLPNGKLLGGIAVAISIAFTALYIPPSPQPLVWPYEWGMVIFWAVLGAVLVLCARSYSGSITEGERELLIYGKEYARKDRVTAADMKKFSSTADKENTIEF